MLVYLRLAKIDYAYIGTLTPHSRTSKLPYIRHNGRCIPDSNMIIQYLVEHVGAKDLDAHLSPEEKAIMLAAMVMLEDSLYFEVVFDRWIVQGDKFLEGLVTESSPPRLVLAFVFYYILMPKSKQALYGQGTGRFTANEIWQRSAAQIAALSNILGSKKFFGGDEPCVADASIFGLLNGCLYVPWSTHRPMIEAHANLVAWCGRVKALAFPDWDELCSGSK